MPMITKPFWMRAGLWMGGVAMAALSGCSHKPIVEDYSAYQGQTATQIFNQGQKDLARGKYHAASKDFEALDTLYPFGLHARQGQLDLIYAYYKNGKMALAQAAADRYIRLYPQGPATDYAYYLRGLASMQQQGSWMQKRVGTDPSGRDPSYFQAAYADFAQINTLYPGSRYAPSSRWFMAGIRNQLAKHDMDVARFYYARHAYVAAANRASTVVTRYEGTSQVVPALAMLVRAYRGLHLNQKAAESLATLKANYGTDPYGQAALRHLHKHRA
jgi:outer membrane protein assembly factor BamD